MNGVTAMAQILKQEGVEWIGCMPSNSLIEAAARAGIRPIVCRQERTGVHMADGFSRIRNGRHIWHAIALEGGLHSIFCFCISTVIRAAGTLVNPNFERSLRTWD
jgi:glyoxylate carboligase